MIFFDSHVHFYPEYDFDVVFGAFSSHARRFAPEAKTLALAVMLRAFQPTLASVFEGRLSGTWRSKGTLADGSLVVTDGEREIFLVPARQVAARERIEVLGFFGETPVPDGLPIRETIGRLREASYTPVLAWGLGKWLLKRAPVVRDVLAEAKGPGELLVADSALRPSFWPTPVPMRAALRKGLRVVWGSDPLPRKADERSAGRYATLIDGALDPVAPAKSLLGLLVDPEIPVRPVGRRYGPIDTIKRLK